MPERVFISNVSSEILSSNWHPFASLSNSWKLKQGPLLQILDVRTWSLSSLLLLHCVPRSHYVDKPRASLMIRDTGRAHSF
jgi:hypothetical protein